MAKFHFTNLKLRQNHFSAETLTGKISNFKNQGGLDPPLHPLPTPMISTHNFLQSNPQQQSDTLSRLLLH